MGQAQRSPFCVPGTLLGAGVWDHSACLGGARATCVDGAVYPGFQMVVTEGREPPLGGDSLTWPISTKLPLHCRHLLPAPQSLSSLHTGKKAHEMLPARESPHVAHPLPSLL